MENVIVEYLKYNKIPVSRQHFKETVRSHADYPSLLSMSDSFKILGIDHVIARIKKEDVHTLAFPYLLHLHRGSGELVMVKNSEDLKSNKSLLQYFSGIYVHVNPAGLGDNSDNKKFIIADLKRKVANCILIFSIICLAFLLFKSLHTIEALLLLSSLAGLILGYTLVAKESGIEYDVVERFCNSSSKSSCNEILKNHSITFFKLFKISDIVLIHFALQFMLLGVSSINSDGQLFIWSVYKYISFLYLPVILISLYYQHFVAKVWCRLCLLVSGVLMLQGCFFFLYKDAFTVFNFHWSLISLFMLLVVASSEFLLRDALSKKSKTSNDLQTASRIKNSVEVFSHLLFKQRQVDTTPFAGEILIGDADAPVKLVMVTNLYCRPCGEQHKQLENVLRNFSDDVSLSIRLVRSGRDAGQAISTNLHVIEYWQRFISNSPDAWSKTEKMLNDWFDVRDFEKFSAKYPLPNSIDLSKSKATETAYTEWFNVTDIRRTPTFFINGFELPNTYRVDELGILLPGLINYFKVEPVAVC